MNPSSIPPPPPPVVGSLPARKLESSIADAPACVQNAMMTKDKKPFTYTPGGIDLSQIKSPRMAKRLEANMNSPGVQSKPSKVSPLAENSSNGNGSAPATPMTPGSVPPPPPPPSMGSLAMGMPFQVFPSEPPVRNNQQLSAPQTNGNNRKSPQSFEPPPMGCRPEIKIPPNPMANLRPAPRPQVKNDFWVQEYVQEKTGNSDPSEEQQFASSHPSMQTPPPHQHQQQMQRQQSPVRSTPKSPTPPERDFSSQMATMKLDEMRTASPVEVVRSSPVMRQSPSLPSSQVKTVPAEPIQAYKQPQPQPQPQQQQFYERPKQQQQVYERPQQQQQQQVYERPQQQQQQQVYERPQQQQQVYQQQPTQSYQQPSQGGRIILSTMPKGVHHQPQQNLGTLYIPPPMSVDDKQYLMNQTSPPWMSSSKMNIPETPEWANRDEVDNFIQQTRMMHAPQSAGIKEHVIPIAVEKSPNKTPTTPGFGPTPFYGTGQQFSNVVSPKIVSPKVDPNVNQFVNQGYSNIDFKQNPSQQQQQRSASTRIIPVHVEGARSPQPSPSVSMQSDPRTPPSPRINAFGPPNQSRSFKILQQVTNTFGADSDDNDTEQQMLDQEPMQEQQPLYSRPLGPEDMSENQLRRMQMSEQDRAFMNRVKNQVDGEIYLHSESDPRYKGSAIPSKAFKVLQIMTDGAPNNVQAAPVGRPKQQEENSDQQNREPHLYQGSAIPSRSFKMLQAMTQPENAGPGLSDL